LPVLGQQETIRVVTIVQKREKKYCEEMMALIMFVGADERQ
jgi:hypothetical protein